MRKYATAHAERVLNWYKDAEGYYDVMLNGHCDDGDDGRHVVIDRNVNALLRRIRNAVPCKCGSCPTK